MKELKNEAALFKEAMIAGVKYAEGRGVVQSGRVGTPCPRGTNID